MTSELQSENVGCNWTFDPWKSSDQEPQRGTIKNTQKNLIVVANASTGDISDYPGKLFSSAAEPDTAAVKVSSAFCCGFDLLVNNSIAYHVG